MLHRWRVALGVVALAMAPGFGALTAQAQPRAGFRFESVASLDEMHRLIETSFPLGTPREALRQTFVTQGAATLKAYPSDPAVEKYLYDINLCSYYVWRWNISADFDAAGHLRQAYVNGEPVFASGPQKKDVKDFKTGHQSIYKVKRPRPEASKGENELTYILFDADSDTNTIDDELAIGGGPSRPDPANMGPLHMYSSVDPWRSIFDKDAAAQIVPYSGSCAAADELYARQQAQLQSRGKP
jgi:hypothetical protein